MNLTRKKLKKLGILALPISTLAMLSLFPSPPHVSGAGTDDGETTYKAKCSICHGADGGGKTAMGRKLKLQDLSSPDVQKQSDGQLFEIVAKGKDKMPAFGKSLGEEKIREVIAYLREQGKKH